MRMQVQSLASFSGLRIRYCCGCGAGQSCSSSSTPNLGTSICHRYSPKKTKIQNTKTHKYTIIKLLNSVKVNKKLAHQCLG